MCLVHGDVLHLEGEGMRLLLASDGSADATQAAEWVAASSLPEGASILILSVVTLQDVTSRQIPIASPLAERLREEGRRAAEQTRAVLGSSGTAAAVRVEEGDAREEIIRVAEEWNADLVVVGSRGLGRAQGFFLGTVSLAIARHSPCPVLVVKGRTRGLGSAVVALDGSEDALNALRFFAQWPKRSDLTLHLVGVVERVPFPRTAPSMIRAELQAAVAAVEGERRDALAQALAAARSVLPAAETTETVTSGDPAGEVLRIADENAVDLIVLGARGLGAVQRLLLGSVSETVLRDARCAVLIATRPGR
jgi:nucleotide-binding universal stress UspA family protein